MPAVQSEVVDLLRSLVLLCAADQSVIDLSAGDKTFISQTLEGHALKI
jgi:uncharacterized cupin superfamily protein